MLSICTEDNALHVICLFIFRMLCDALLFSLSPKNNKQNTKVNKASKNQVSQTNMPWRSWNSFLVRGGECAPCFLLHPNIRARRLELRGRCRRISVVLTLKLTCKPPYAIRYARYMILRYAFAYSGVPGAVEHTFQGTF